MNNLWQLSIIFRSRVGPGALWPRSYDRQLYFYLEPTTVSGISSLCLSFYLLLLYLVNDVSSEPGPGGHVHAVDQKQRDKT